MPKIILFLKRNYIDRPRATGNAVADQKCPEGQELPVCDLQHHISFTCFLSLFKRSPVLKNDLGESWKDPFLWLIGTEDNWNYFAFRTYCIEMPTRLPALWACVNMYALCISIHACLYYPWKVMIINVLLYKIKKYSMTPHKK